MSLHTHLQLLISRLVADVRPRTCHWHHTCLPGCLTNSSSAPSVVFVWLLGFVCLLFPDGRHRLHLSSFQVPREIFTALAEALILFPLVGLYDRPFIQSNWKQLSLPVWAGGGSTSKPGSNLSPLNPPTIYCHATVVCFSKEWWYWKRKPLVIVAASPDVKLAEDDCWRAHCLRSSCSFRTRTLLNVVWALLRSVTSCIYRKPGGRLAPVNVGEDQWMSLLIGCGFKTSSNQSFQLHKTPSFSLRRHFLPTAAEWVYTLTFQTA